MLQKEQRKKRQPHQLNLWTEDPTEILGRRPGRLLYKLGKEVPQLRTEAEDGRVKGHILQKTRESEGISSHV